MQLVDGADVARAQLGDGRLLLAADEVDGVDALLGVRVGVEDGHARLQNAAAHAEIIELAHEGVDRRLEDLRREGGVLIAGDADDGVLFKVGGGHFGALGSLGQILHDLVHQVDDALVLQGAARHDGDDVDVVDALADAVDDVLARELAVFEVLFEQHVVVLGGGFRQGKAHLVEVAAVRVGDRDLFGARVGEAVRLFCEGVDVARHLVAFHHGDLDGRYFILILFLQRADGAVVVGVVLIHAVDEDDEGLFRPQTLVDRLLGADGERAVCAHDDDRRAASAHRLVDFALKIVKAGAV